MDSRIKLKAISSSTKPNTAVYLAMHQCVTDKAVESTALDESKCGEIIVKNLLASNRGHFSPFEQATIQISFSGVPHNAMQQLLRSRIGVSPSVQSYRYTKEHLIKAVNGLLDIEDIIYIRPADKYYNPTCGIYNYTENDRNEDLEMVKKAVAHCVKRMGEGMPAEMARGQLPFDYRQNMVVTFNARSIMAMLDRRTKKDAQLEVRYISDLLLEIFESWMPETAEWYKKNRYGKAILAP